jgi:hypothetical protein
VIGLVGGTVSAAARTTGHTISFAVTGTIMIALVIYIRYTAKNRFGSHWHTYGPTYLCMLAALMIMADLSRHVLQDAEVWPAGPWPGSSQYRSDCHEESMECLSAVGWIFTIALTYGGFGTLFIGTLWNASICEKLADFKQKWRELREQSRQADAATATDSNGIHVQVGTSTA